ncbi:hypothetical protein SDC9_154948 [bioreactor metagenome]|uniref:Uncharacterized protein n=1 Tax=bioreactor metagenome TaxID=1076179 RepID=A0A645F0F8_9ZZZZ
MAVGAAPKVQLDKVARLQFLQREHLHAEGAGPLALAGDVIIEILHPRPGWGLVVGVDVIPSKGGGKVHHPGARVETLGSKVGAVAPQKLVVVISGISAQSPLMRVGNGKLAIVRNDQQ